MTTGLLPLVARADDGMTWLVDTTGPDDGVAAALAALRGRLDACRFPLDLPLADEARREARAAVQEIDDHLLPRSAHPDAPLLAVLGGSTGAGKSTLVNSLVGHVVSPGGVLRPTTRAPVLVHSPDDAAWFHDRRVLPRLSREGPDEPPDPGEPALSLVAAPEVPEGLALLDAPDLDSVVTTNRFLGGRLLAAADLWVFVTSATRYADAVPWQFLRAAVNRGAAVAVVLDRVPPATAERVGGHLARLLASQGLGSAPLFVVRESSLDDGVLPDAEIAPLRRWLVGTAADPPTRKAVLRRTTDGALAILPPRVVAILDSLAAQSAAVESLRRVVDTAYAGAVRRVHVAARDGSVLGGRVRARWAEFVGGHELLRALERAPSSKWRRATGLPEPGGSPGSGDDALGAIRQSVEALFRAEADRAADEVTSGWASQPAGPGLLETWEGDAGGSTPDMQKQIPAEAAAWQDDVLALVRRQAQGKRTARSLTHSAEGLTFLAMVAALAGPEPRSQEEPADVDTPRGPGAASRALLDAVLGGEAVDVLVDGVLRTFRERVDALFNEEQARVSALLDVGVDPDAVPLLRQALDRFETERGTV